MSTTARFRVQGMDCAFCATKIETAVKRIAGVESVKVGLHTETLAVVFGDISRREAVEGAVSSLGYKATLLIPHGGTESAGLVDGPQSPDESGEHSDHGEPIEGAWWGSTKGLLVIATGVLVGLAYLESYLLSYGSQSVFLAAAAVGTFPVAKRALSALGAGSLFTIEMLMTIAVIGAVTIGATEEAAIVVFLFAVGELLEGVAAGRARSGIRGLAKIAPQTAMVETPSGLAEQRVSDIAVGSIVVVRPGDRVPADGVIVSVTHHLMRLP